MCDDRGPEGPDGTGWVPGVDGSSVVDHCVPRARGVGDPSRQRDMQIRACISTERAPIPSPSIEQPSVTSLVQRRTHRRLAGLATHPHRTIPLAEGRSAFPSSAAIGPAHPSPPEPPDKPGRPVIGPFGQDPRRAPHASHAFDAGHQPGAWGHSLERPRSASSGGLTGASQFLGFGAGWTSPVAGERITEVRVRSDPIES